ncbi:GLUTATHIONE S-TRANSFERASE GST SUPERFAMILY GST DOMAIN CONTAINING [Salix purpurea]|uniref:glutathione transferase n=1 Tax=Salix purpurea TaxID=77065 RepID=A0A9Q0TWY0_SALPP|nr:GLUTATHIONE S-TRANSFERASE GST SUPERFAMILY GST DOMAIN CONTAINING [Salix purpurea]
MAEQPKLLGTLPSPFVHRVIWALKLKAIPYEFIIEEDLTNKSPLLLKYNPVHKKVPVFLHGDKPVCESMIIVEYIDEVWPQNPLLPKDPYERAQARFWVKFAEDKGTPVLWRMFSSKGEELEKTKKETLEMLQTVEEHGIGEKKFFGGDSIGIADIAFGSVVYGLEIIEEALGEGAVFEAHRFPRLHAWIKNFKQVPIIKENLAERDWMVALFKNRREALAGSA